MVCKRCKTESVIRLTNSNIKLCRGCFVKYFEKKVFKTIEKYKLIKNEEKIGVACSGGKDSLSTLQVLDLYRSKKRNIDLTAIAIDEGIKGYRDKTLEGLKEYCKENEIKLVILSFNKEFNLTLDQAVKKLKKKGIKPCSVCGVFRRYLLNKYGRKLKLDKLATGHNLDDEVQAILMNQFRNDVEINARLGPITGVIDHKGFVKRIKPLYFLTEKEVMTYAFIKKLTFKFNECPYVVESYRNSVRDMINDFEKRYPGTKHGILQSFMEVIPLLKKHYKGGKEIRKCKKCKEPCSLELCQACYYREMLK